MPPKHIVFRSGCIGSAKHCVMRGEGYWQVTGGPKAAVHSTILLALRRTCYWQVAGGPKAAVHSTILLARSCENDWQVAGGHKAAAHCANSELRGKIGRDQNGKSGVKPGVHSHKHSCIPSFVVDYNGLQHYREVHYPERQSGTQFARFRAPSQHRASERVLHPPSKRAAAQRLVG